MNTQELVIQILVIAGFGIWAYSKVKGISLMETIEEIKEFISKFKDGQ